MARLTLTRDLAWAASMDAGNRAMRHAGRTVWSADDYNVYVREFDRLWPCELDGFPSNSGHQGEDQCVQGQ